MASELTTSYRHANMPASGHWSSLFDLCKGRCRTTSNSTVHENDYVSNRHYCFSANGRPLLPPLPEPPPEGVALQPATQGESCEAACARLGAGDPGPPQTWQCSAKHGKYVNNCNVMRQFFICQLHSVGTVATQAGCEMSEGPDQPSYVLSDAPKTHRPTTCFIHEPALLEGGFACNGSHAQTQRLCPCRLVDQLQR